MLGQFVAERTTAHGIPPRTAGGVYGGLSPVDEMPRSTGKECFSVEEERTEEVTQIRLN